MKQGKFSVLYLLPLMLLLNCGSTTLSDKTKFYGISRDRIGIRHGSSITFYQNHGSNIWLPEANNDFDIPGDAKQVYGSDNEMAVFRNNGHLDFYRNLAPGHWEAIPKESVEVPKGYDRVTSFGDVAIGFIKGKTIDFHSIYKGVPDFSFTAPDDATDFFTGLGEGVYVTTKKGIDWYLYDFKEKKWQVQPQSHLDYPSGMKSVLPCYSDFAVGIIKDKAIDFYVTGFKEAFPETRYQTTFTLPK